MDIPVNNMKEYNIEKIIGDIDFNKNKLHKIKTNLYLTTYEIEILKKYHIIYEKCQSNKEIIQNIEYIINDLDKTEQEELDQVSMSIAERDYYQNTKK